MAEKPKQLTIENIQYAKPKPYPPKKWEQETCKRSSVEPRHGLAAATNQEGTMACFPFDHAGMLTHVCWELKGHADEYCKCPCGYRWRAILEPTSQKRVQE